MQEQEDKPYTPLSERINQDVWHDNFVPKYSELASVRPSRLVLIGVWMIFAPATAMLLVEAFVMFPQSPGAIAGGIISLGLFFTAFICAAILFQQTRRYLNRDQTDRVVFILQFW